MTKSCTEIPEIKNEVLIFIQNSYCLRPQLIKRKSLIAFDSRTTVQSSSIFSVDYKNLKIKKLKFYFLNKPILYFQLLFL
jgi:hypothetical protein